MRRKKIGLFLAVVVSLLDAFSVAAAATQFADERLNYVISYKWGLIHKDAGEATLSLRRSGGEYNLMLSARSKPWVDRFFQLRDTLKGKLKVSDLTPVSYAKLTHEKNYHAKDVITYSRNGGITTGKTKQYRYGEGGETVTEKTLTASGPVYDMLSVFYYLRQLDYASLAKNKIYRATVFSGSMAEEIRIQSIGKEEITLRNKRKVEAFRIRFNFTSDGGKKSSDDIDVWISTDPAHIPLYLVGKLPIGEVRAYYTGPVPKT